MGVSGPRFRYKLNIAKFVFKHGNQLLPDIFNNLFIENSHVHSHNTRQTDNLYMEYSKNQFVKLKTKNQGAIIWNSIPSNIQNCKTIKNIHHKF